MFVFPFMVTRIPEFNQRTNKGLFCKSKLVTPSTVTQTSIITLVHFPTKDKGYSIIVVISFQKVMGRVTSWALQNLGPIHMISSLVSCLSFNLCYQ